MGGVAAVAFAAWMASGIYLVQPSERAVIFTFGAVGKNDWAGPGLHYHLPMPIQHVEKVAVTTLNFADVGGGANADAPAESLMLTGDEQIIDLDFRVTWRIDDPAKYLFAVRDPDKAVKAVAESAMREVVGKTPLQPIISTGRGAVQQQTKALMQHTLDGWGAGIEVVEVQIRQAQPPPEVIAAFRDVNNAQ
ncbi:MAG TPA: protease modulator HflK [Phenylobacterium sp.]